MIDENLQKLSFLDEQIREVELAAKEKSDAKRHLSKQREELARKIANEMVESGCTSSDVNGVRWSIRNTPAKVIVTDEKTIPPKFFKERVSKSLDKTLLKTALKTGATIQGASLDNGSITLVAKGITA